MFENIVMMEINKMNIQRCNTCSGVFGEDCYYQSFGNRQFLATMKKGKVVQECCEECVQEIEDMVEGDPINDL